MENNYEKIKELAKKAGIGEGKINNEFLFTIQMVDYFYYNKNIGEQDIRENFVDGALDGGIDYIFIGKKCIVKNLKNLLNQIIVILFIRRFNCYV